MRRIMVGCLEPGMKLARSIYTSDGKILLGEGVCLTGKYIERLQGLDISSVYIDDEISEGIEIPDVISEQTRLAAIHAVKEISVKVRLGNPPDLVLARKTINMIIDELFNTSDVVVQMFNLRDNGSYLIGHMTNVAVLSILTGVTLGYNELQLRDLGMGAFLHDIGMLALPDTTYQIPRAITDKEFVSIKEHPMQGFEAVRRIELMNTLSAHVAFQHHERYDGSGYPRGLAKTDIHEYARIVAIADVYDALTTDRPHRKAMLPGQAVEYLVTMAGTMFDPYIVEAFMQRVAVFPIGSIVELNTEEVAIVVATNSLQQTRPTVRVFANSLGHRLSPPIVKDLMQYRTLFITKVLEEYKPVPRESAS